MESVRTVCVCRVARWCLPLCTPWTVACQAPLSMAFSRQGYWSGLPSPSPRDPPHPGFEPTSLTSPASASGFFTTRASWETQGWKIEWWFPFAGGRAGGSYCVTDTQFQLSPLSCLVYKQIVLECWSVLEINLGHEIHEKSTSWNISHPNIPDTIS